MGRIKPHSDRIVSLCAPLILLLTLLLLCGCDTVTVRPLLRDPENIRRFVYKGKKLRINGVQVIHITEERHQAPAQAQLRCGPQCRIGSHLFPVDASRYMITAAHFFTSEDAVHGEHLGYLGGFWVCAEAEFVWQGDAQESGGHDP